MRYEEVRVELSATPKGRFKSQVSMDGSAMTESFFDPPEGVDGAALYNEWYDSFNQEPSPDAKRTLDGRRREAGEQLFESLFASAASRVLERLKVLEDRFRTEGVERQGLRVRLLLGDAWGKGRANAEAILPAASLPYELMVPPGLPKFLARRPFVSIVRTIGVGEGVGPIAVSGNLRVLVAIAKPRGLKWSKEVDKIRRALEGLTETTVEVLKNASFEATCERLRDGDFHVLHFIGHGGYDTANGQWYLLFEKKRARQPVLAETIADRLSNMPRLRLAVLNACHTGELPREAGGDPLAGVAAALSVHGLPAVVGMQVAVTDSAAIDFANAFYSALREREPIEVAVADGRSAIDVSSPEWATPVLYLRGQNSDLFSGEKTGGPVIRGDGQPALKLGIRTLVKSDRFPQLADWAKKLETSTDKLLALERSFKGRFIVDPKWWSSRVLPRLNRFLASAVEQKRPLVLNMVAHGTVAFAAGYYFHTKATTKLSIVQAVPGKQEPEHWSEKEGPIPKGPLWSGFEEKVLDAALPDVAIAVEIAQGVTGAVQTYLAKTKTNIGRLVIASIAGGTGNTQVESGAHAYQLALRLQQWLKDHTGDRSQRRLHLFISAPNGFVFFLGKLAQSLGSIRLYEYDLEAKGHATYEPSLDLPQAAQE